MAVPHVKVCSIYFIFVFSVPISSLLFKQAANLFAPFAVCHCFCDYALALKFSNRAAGLGTTVSILIFKSGTAMCCPMQPYAYVAYCVAHLG